MQIHIPRLPMAWGWRKGPQLPGVHPAQDSHPTTQAGPFFLGRCILAVTARSWVGFGWSCWGWLELAWKGGLVGGLGKGC